MKTNSIVNNFKRSKPKKVGERFKKDITKMRVALIGSTDYENRGEIKELVWNLKQKVGDDLIIVTRGNKHGVEKWVRKFSLEMGIKYIEYNAAHTPMSLYSGMDKDYYGKPYHPTQPLHQYDCVVRNSDKIIYFGDMLRNEFQHFNRVLTRNGKKAKFVT